MRPAIALILVIAGMFLAGLSFGDITISWHDLALVLTGDDNATPQASLMIWTVRMPRLLVALLVGLALAVAGVISQAVLRNPLADPGLLGINSGASLAAMVVLVGLDGVPATVLPLAGFAGAALVAIAIHALSWRAGTSSIRILLIGIGLSSLAGGATTFLSAFGDVRDVQRAMIWMTGSVYDSNWIKVETLLAWSIAPIALTWLGAHHLDTIGLGDGTARSLGQRVHLTRSLLMLTCTILSGAAIAAAGLIGFVGLVAPHLARRLVGPMHRQLVPISGLTGGALVVAADLVGRVVIAPAQLPAGLTTALLGAPFFAYLMWERRNA
jgi:iron complex transport system permease protein